MNFHVLLRLFGANSAYRDPFNFQASTAAAAAASQQRAWPRLWIVSPCSGIILIVFPFVVLIVNEENSPNVQGKGEQQVGWPDFSALRGSRRNCLPQGIMEGRVLVVVGRVDGWDALGKAVSSGAEARSEAEPNILRKKSLNQSAMITGEMTI